MNPPQISPSLFWDSDPATLNWDRHTRYVIERVLLRGAMQDWFEIKRYYGLAKIKKVALNARYLDKKTLSFCSVYFDLPQEKFRCTQTPPSIRKLWDF